MANLKPQLDTSDQALSPIFETKESLAAERRKKRQAYKKESFHPKLVDEKLEEGWEHDKDLKTKVRLKKLKSFDERLENKFWCLLHDMGYPVMNAGRQFKITYSKKKGEFEKKQIDVFAKDEETVVIAECKTSTELKKKSLQNELEAFANLRKPIADAVRKFYGNNFKPKILWFFVTENIVWTTPDINRAKNENILVITEKEFLYFRQLADHIGKAARYQFLAEYLAGQKIPELSGKKIPAIRGKLGGKLIYSFVSTPKELLKICFVNHRSLDDPEGMPTYQRLIIRSRKKSIENFLKKGGFFPNSLLINFNKKISFDIIKKEKTANVNFGYLTLPDTYKSAWVIDGQHRLYGFSNLDEKTLSQNIFIIAFDQLPKPEEADLFVTINSQQKSVPPSLIEDLAGDLKWGSEKPNEIISSTGARLIKVMNNDLGGPLYDRVVGQGLKTTDRTCLTVTGVMNGLRPSGLIGKTVQKNKLYEPGPLSGSTQSQTLQRALEFLTLYFNQVREANFSRWDKGKLGMVCTNVGINGFLNLAAELIRYAEQKGGPDAKELSPKDLVLEIQDQLQFVLDYIATASDEEIEQRLKVVFGSGVNAGVKIHHLPE